MRHSVGTDVPTKKRPYIGHLRFVLALWHKKMHIYIIYARDMYEDDIYKLPIRKTVNCANCANYP